MDCAPPPPAKADMIVVLGGSPTRPLYAADLYREGVAPEVWVPRPYRGSAAELLEELRARPEPEEEVYRRILLRKGVPAGRIRIYGDGVMSTSDEAVSLRREARLDGKRLLVVTSPWHARRARWVFRRELPGTEVSVAATPYEEFSRRWWTRQALANAAILETAKVAYYLLGGRFLSRLDNTPHVH